MLPYDLTLRRHGNTSSLPHSDTIPVDSSSGKAWKLLIRLVLSRIILVLDHFPATIVVLMMVLLGPLALSHGPVAIIILMPTLLRMILAMSHSTVIMVTLVVILAKKLVA